MVAGNFGYFVLDVCAVACVVVWFSSVYGYVRCLCCGFVSRVFSGLMVYNVFLRGCWLVECFKLDVVYCLVVGCLVVLGVCLRVWG